jgi:hypothetical protein
MNKEDERQFFASKANPPHRVHIGGKKVHVSDFPKEEQDFIKKRIAEKDHVMKKAMENTKFGIKIDGQEVGKDNIHDFEISKHGEISKAGKEYLKEHKSEISKIKKEVKSKPEVKSKVKEPVGLTLEQLYNLNKSEQVEILKELGVVKVPRLEKGRVEKILKLTEGNKEDSFIKKIIKKILGIIK